MNHRLPGRPVPINHSHARIRGQHTLPPWRMKCARLDDSYSQGWFMRNQMTLVAVLFAALLVGCAPGQRQTSTASPDEPPRGRTQVFAHRYEVATLAPKVAQNNGPTSTTRLFN